MIRGRHARSACSRPAAALAQAECDRSPAAASTPRRGDAVYDVVTDRPRPARAQRRRTGSRTCCATCPASSSSAAPTPARANPTSQGATLRALGGNASSRALLLLDGVPQTDPFGGWISLAGLRSAPARPGPGDARRRHRRQRPGRARRHDRARQRRARTSCAGSPAGLAYGSRDGIDAFAGYGARARRAASPAVSAAWARGDGFIPIVAEPARAGRPALALPAGEPRRRAPSRRSRRAIELQANRRRPSPTSASAAPRSARSTPTAPTPRCGWSAAARLPFSALAYVQVRDFSNAVRRGQRRPRRRRRQTLDQYSVPSTGLGARFEIRPRHRPGRAPARRATGARRRGGPRSCSSSSPARRRAAASPAAAPARSAPSPRRAGRRGPLTLTGGGRLDHWRIEDGQPARAHARHRRAAHRHRFPRPQRLGADRPRRHRLARRRSALTLRAAAYLGWRLPTLNELYRPFRVGADATAANAALAPERLRGRRGRDRASARAAARRIGLTLFANRLDDAIANVTLGQGPGIFPGVGFVAAGGQYPPAAECRRGRAAAAIEIDASLDLGRFRLAAGYSFADAEVARRAAPARRSTACAPPRRRATAPRPASPGRARAAPTPRSAPRYVSAPVSRTISTRQLIPDALTFDAVAVAAARPRRLALEARGENLTDARVVAGISGAGIVERATPRTLVARAALAGLEFCLHPARAERDDVGGVDQLAPRLADQPLAVPAERQIGLEDRARNNPRRPSPRCRRDRRGSRSRHARGAPSAPATT